MRMRIPAILCSVAAVVNLAAAWTCPSSSNLLRQRPTTATCTSRTPLFQSYLDNLAPSQGTIQLKPPPKAGVSSVGPSSYLDALTGTNNGTPLTAASDAVSNVRQDEVNSAVQKAEQAFQQAAATATPPATSSTTSNNNNNPNTSSSTNGMSYMQALNAFSAAKAGGSTAESTKPKSSSYLPTRKLTTKSTSPATAGIPGYTDMLNAFTQYKAGDGPTPKPGVKINPAKAAAAQQAAQDVATASTPTQEETASKTKQPKAAKTKQTEPKEAQDADKPAANKKPPAAAKTKKQTPAAKKEPRENPVVSYQPGLGTSLATVSALAAGAYFGPPQPYVQQYLQQAHEQPIQSWFTQQAKATLSPPLQLAPTAPYVNQKQPGKTLDQVLQNFKGPIQYSKPGSQLSSEQTTLRQVLEAKQPVSSAAPDPVQVAPPPAVVIPPPAPVQVAPPPAPVPVAPPAPVPVAPLAAVTPPITQVAPEVPSMTAEEQQANQLAQDAVNAMANPTATVTTATPTTTTNVAPPPPPPAAVVATTSTASAPPLTPEEQQAAELAQQAVRAMMAATFYLPANFIDHGHYHPDVNVHHHNIYEDVRVENNNHLDVHWF